MPMSVIMVYQPLDSFTEKRSYWEKYTRFYERYWGGPTSPFGVWFGQEYNNFRELLSKELGMEKPEIQDCYFMKEGENYFVCPLIKDANPYLMTSDNFIPLEWFVPFNAEERRYIYAQWGFGSMHYHTLIATGLERIARALDVIENFSSSPQDTESYKIIGETLAVLRARIEELRGWLAGFDHSGFVLLNYGELTSVIHPYTLKNEQSVLELWQVFELVEAQKYEDARTALSVLIQKWEDIRRKAVGETEKPAIQ